MATTRFHAALGLTAALMLGACGGGAAEIGAATPNQTPTPAPAQPAPADDDASKSEVIPNVNVLQVSTGNSVNLQDLAVGKDTIFWFWAPH